MDEMEVFDDRIQRFLKEMGERINKELVKQAMAKVEVGSTCEAMFSNLEGMVQKGQATRLIEEIEQTSSIGEPSVLKVKSSYYLKGPTTSTASSAIPSSITYTMAPSTSTTTAYPGSVSGEWNVRPAIVRIPVEPVGIPAEPTPEEPDTGKRKSMKDKEIEKLRAMVGELQSKLDVAEKHIVKLTTGNPYRGMRTRKEVEDAVARCNQMTVKLELQWVLGEID